MYEKILIYIGFYFSFLYTKKINSIIQYVKMYIYTGWMKRRFKKFEGLITGKITLHDSNCISVGKNTIIKNNVRLFAWEYTHDQHFEPEIIIGDNSVIQEDCYISAVDKVIIGNRVAVTEHTMILDNTHGDFQDNHLTFNESNEVPDVYMQNAFSRPIHSKGPVVIEDDVHIGMFCTILPGSKIGHNSIIAAHSVVARKIPPYSLVAGNPAEIVMTFGRNKK